MASCWEYRKLKVWALQALRHGKWHCTCHPSSPVITRHHPSLAAFPLRMQPQRARKPSLTAKFNEEQRRLWIQISCRMKRVGSRTYISQVSQNLNMSSSQLPRGLLSPMVSKLAYTSKAILQPLRIVVLVHLDMLLVVRQDWLPNMFQSMQNSER